MTSCVNGVRSRNRRRAPGSARKNPVVCRSSRTTRKPASRIHSASRRSVTRWWRSSSFCFPSAASAMKVFASLRSLQRPGRVARQAAERAEGEPAAEQQVQWHRHQQAGQVRSRQRLERRGREVEDAARPQHAVALGQVGARVQHVLDDGMAEHQVEDAVAERERLAVALHEPGARDALLGGEARAGADEAAVEVEADREPGLLRDRQRRPAAAAARVEHAPADAAPARSTASITFALRRYSHSA